MGFVILLLIAAAMLILNALAAYLNLKMHVRAHDAERKKQTKKERE